MRRPRTKLQVSTFPFLAVLLGAMGSLIFLLLVMDRRAKVVARNKVRDTVEARAAAERKTELERRAAWEQQRTQLHATLAAEDAEWRRRLQHVARELTSVAGQVDQEKASEGRLLDAIAREQQALAQAKDRLEGRRSLLMKSTQMEETTRAELARLSRELLELQEAADALKRLKSQQRPTYSLVPYRGQRGAHRIPVYVECTHIGLTFLPEGKALPGLELDVAAFRAEVERRHGPLLKEQKNADPFRTPESDQPYVLFLVRPEGVPIYYRAQQALRGFQIDYGYELVDADWALDVPTAAQFAKLSASAPLAPVLGGEGLGVRGVAPLAKSGVFARGAVPPHPSPLPLSTGGEGAGAATSSGQYVSQLPKGMAPNITPGATFAGPGLTLSQPAGLQSPAKKAGNGGLQKTAPATIALGAPVGGEASAGLAGSMAERGAPLASTGDPGGLPSPLTPTLSPRVQGEREPLLPRRRPDAPPADGSAMGRLAAPLPGLEKKGTPAAANRVVGNREFVINLACYADGVVVTPGSAAFNWTTAPDPRQIEDALVRNVNQLITRRQAAVRPGEAPPRVLLRFVVHPEGLRSMYRVYPLLEGFRLPMVRENVEE